MINYATNTLTKISTLETTPVEMIYGASSEEITTVIRAVYRWVFGNAHIMESERLTLSVPESKCKSGEISVREFVRQIAKSELYRARFFDNCPRYRAIELNFKHLLGRAPNDYTETFYHSQILDEGGFEAEIDWYIDSDEYQMTFGENIVPFCQGNKTQTGKKLLGFTNTLKLQPTFSGSDKAGESKNQSRLSRSLIYNNPSGQAPVTDIQQLLAEVFKPKISVTPTPYKLVIGEVYQNNGQIYQNLRIKCEEQAKSIEILQKQLKEMSPSAMIGVHVLRAGDFVGNSQVNTASYFPTQLSGTVQTENSLEVLLARSKNQEEAIANLEAQISGLRSFVAIGDSRLNKWRKRIFS